MILVSRGVTYLGGGWSQFAWSHGTDVYSRRWPPVKWEISWSAYLKFSQMSIQWANPVPEEIKTGMTRNVMDQAWNTLTGVKGLEPDKRVCAQWQDGESGQSDKGREKKQHLYSSCTQILWTRVFISSLWALHLQFNINRETQSLLQTPLLMAGVGLQQICHMETAETFQTFSSFH